MRMTFADVVHSVLVRKSAKLLVLVGLATFTWSSVAWACQNLANGECASAGSYTYYGDCSCGSGYVCGSQGCGNLNAAPWPLGPSCGNEFPPLVRQVCTPITTTYLGCPCGDDACM
jgi:hypothetical protein